MLFHCQLYHLGDMYDLEELKTQAYVNVLRQCEFGCSSPEKPIDLCAAIQYLYQHLPNDKRVANTILDYCVSCFLRHRLGEDQEFRSLAYELRPFHQALCANTRERGFEDEGKTCLRHSHCVIEVDVARRASALTFDRGYRDHTAPFQTISTGHLCFAR